MGVFPSDMKLIGWIFFWIEAILAAFQRDHEHVDSQKSVLGFFRSFNKTFTQTFTRGF